MEIASCVGLHKKDTRSILVASLLYESESTFESIHTFESTKVLSYFRTKVLVLSYFRTFVRKYFQSTFVLSYTCTVQYVCVSDYKKTVRVRVHVHVHVHVRVRVATIISLSNAARLTSSVHTVQISRTERSIGRRAMTNPAVRPHAEPRGQTRDRSVFRSPVPLQHPPPAASTDERLRRPAARRNPPRRTSSTRTGARRRRNDARETRGTKRSVPAR